MGCLLPSLVVWFWLSLCQVFLVGHDWGASIGWEVCRLRPDRVIAYVAVSVPFRIWEPDVVGHPVAIKWFPVSSIFL
jgi:pimeloyl-ACP methyl ester carboxylesterase